VMVVESAAVFALGSFIGHHKVGILEQRTEGLFEKILGHPKRCSFPHMDQQLVTALQIYAFVKSMRNLGQLQEISYWDAMYCIVRQNSSLDPRSQFRSNMYMYFKNQSKLPEESPFWSKCMELKDKVSVIELVQLAQISAIVLYNQPNRNHPDSSEVKRIAAFLEEVHTCLKKVIEEGTFLNCDETKMVKMSLYCALVHFEYCFGDKTRAQMFASDVVDMVASASWDTPYSFLAALGLPWVLQVLDSTPQKNALEDTLTMINHDSKFPIITSILKLSVFLLNGTSNNSTKKEQLFAQ